MKTQPVSKKSGLEALHSSPSTAESSDSCEISSNSTEFHEISPYSTPVPLQVVETQMAVRKQHPGILAQKISPEQRPQLFEWLADHTYDEVVDLVGAEPPEGFGIKVGKSTLSRFYKTNFREIDRLRQQHIETRAVGMLWKPFDHDYRAMLRDSYSQLLLERLWELLSRPVESADELKKLTVIAEKMKSLDRDKELLDELREEQRRAEINKLFSGLSANSGTPQKSP